MIRACQKNENAAFDGWKRRFLDSIIGGRFNTGLPAHGQVAQSVEQWTENPRVGGSIPPLGTIPLGSFCFSLDFPRVGTDPPESWDTLFSI